MDDNSQKEIGKKREEKNGTGQRLETWNEKRFRKIVGGVRRNFLETIRSAFRSEGRESGRTVDETAPYSLVLISFLNSLKR